MIRSAT